MLISGLISTNASVHVCGRWPPGQLILLQQRLEKKKHKGWAIGMTFGFYEKPGRMRVVMVSLKLIRTFLVVGRVRI